MNIASDHPRPTVLVTGVSSGIGHAIAEDLLTRGYAVLGSVRRAQDALPLQQGWPETFVPLQFDVTDTEALPAIVQQVEALVAGRGLKALVNNAGVFFGGPQMHQPLSEVRKAFDVNVFGMLAVTQAFLPLLGARRDRTFPAGRIVNIGSVSGALTVPFMTTYSMTKHAVEALTQGFRRELSIYGIEVCAIEPGMIRSKMIDKRSGEKLEERYAHTDYAAWLVQFDRALQLQEQNSPAPDRVTAAVRHAIESPKPRTRYPLDKGWLIARLLSDRMFDKIIFKELGLKRTP